MSSSSLISKVQDRIDIANEAVLASIKDLGPVQSLNEAMAYYPAAGGKRLRPLLAMLVGDAVARKGKETLPLGIALELTHNFTLVHDDLMDKDEIRRGIQSLHRKFGDETAINAGDALFARAFEVLASLEVDHGVLKEVLKEFSWMVRGIAEGQQLDMEFETRTDVTEQEYLTMVEKKTALMFWMAAKGGAMVATDDKEAVEALGEYGRIMGIGFQIWDDLLDIIGEQEKIGKTVGSDLMNGKKTLIVVHATPLLQGEDRSRFFKVFGNLAATPEEIGDAIAALRNVGAIQYAEKMAMDYCGRAKELISFLPPSEEKDLLIEFVDYMIKRDY